MRSRTHVLSTIVAVAVALTSALIFSSVAIERAHAAEVQKSVEIGLAEASPRGAVGGYAVPASGGSRPPQTASLQLSPTTINQGNNARLRWRWENATYGVNRVTVTRCRQEGRTVSNCTSWANVTEKEGSEFGGAVRTYSCFWIMTCNNADEVKNGRSPWYDARSSALTPGRYAYRAVVRFGSGGSQTVSATLRVNGPTTPVTPPPATLPNLTVTSLSHNPSNPRVGSAVTIQGQIRNSDAGAGASIARYCINGTSCTDHAISSMGNGGTATVNRSWTPTAQGTYSVRLCADAGGAVNESNESDNCGTGSVATYTVTVNPAPQNPTASLQVRNVTRNSSWESPAVSEVYEIVAGEEIALRWSSSNATSCNGTNFSTGGSTGNTQNTITEPALGNSTVYTVQCNDTDSSTPAASDAVTVSSKAALPSLTASKNTVRTNEPFTLTWNLNGNVPAQCVISGAGSTFETPGSITTQTGSMTIDAIGTATYTLDCAAGDDEETITVLPEIYET